MNGKEKMNTYENMVGDDGMSEKYEEFKEWFTTKKFKAKKDYTWYDPSVLFKEFEEEQAEKQHKQEIMETIWETLKAHVTYIEYSIDGVHYKLHPSEAIYNKLKEKDLIK